MIRISNQQVIANRTRITNHSVQRPSFFHPHAIQESRIHSAVAVLTLALRNIVYEIERGPANVRRKDVGFVRCCPSGLLSPRSPGDQGRSDRGVAVRMKQWRVMSDRNGCRSRPQTLPVRLKSKPPLLSTRHSTLVTHLPTTPAPEPPRADRHRR